MLFPDRPITLAHIRQHCAIHSEGFRVEYKANFDENVKQKIAKVVSSFANSHGGSLIIGVATDKGVPIPPFDGFTPPARDELRLTVENICLQSIYPRLIPSTSVVPSDVPGKVFLIIEVEESAAAPHAIENSKRVYVRTQRRNRNLHARRKAS